MVPSLPLMWGTVAFVAVGTKPRTSAPPNHRDVLYLPLDGGNKNLGISLHPVLLHLKLSAPSKVAIAKSSWRKDHSPL